MLTVISALCEFVSFSRRRGSQWNGRISYYSDYNNSLDNSYTIVVTFDLYIQIYLVNH